MEAVNVALVALLMQMMVDVSAVDMWWNLGVEGPSVWRGGSQVYMLGAATGTGSGNGNNVLVNSNRPMCQIVPGLSPGQVKFCHLYPDHMPSISRGAQLAIKECQWQFRSRRWNCSTVADSSVFGPVVDLASREAAFAHSISAAGVVHVVSRACRDGELTTCSCSRRPRPSSLNADWLWGGCGDNTDYGYRFAVGFIDIREKEKNFPRHSKELARMLMNLHNNEAGRRAVFNYVKVGCKCHGVSGSCSLRTCWNQLPSFREAGDRLRDRYDGATEVTFNTQGTRLVQRNRKFNRPTREDLVYVEQSRDFCDADPSAGSPGTRGRTCDRHSNGMDGCDLMCCGRGYRTTKTKISERCRCRFQWCCRVECDTCERNVELNTCK